MYEHYDRAVRIVLDYLVEQGYSRTPRKNFRRATREFGTHLADLHVEFSAPSAEAWLATLRAVVPHHRYLSCTRAIALVHHAVLRGSIESLPIRFGGTPTTYETPPCFRPLLDSYLARRSEDGCQHSTLQMDRIACTRFLLYLQSQQINDVVQIEPGIIKEYHKQTEHRTVDGKNAYMRRVRGFIRYLASVGSVPATLELTIPTEKARRVTIVKTLSKAQIGIITEYTRVSRTASQLRSTAMTLLALRMGLRSIDICDLRLSDISWKLATISIVQRKTGKPLTLPFPVEVGNALTRYILHGRPDCDATNVFVTLKHPYKGLSNSSACYHSAISILGERSSKSEARGLHIARRTYASRLLEAETPVLMISAALGHVDESSVDE